MTKRALLIGINRYAIAGANLRGCINDVTGIQSVLTKYMGFRPSHITMLQDLGATTAKIRKEVSTLMKNAKRGDILLLHFSGHGSNVPDDDGDEAEGRDEIVCPSDISWRDPIRDDWLRKTFDSLPNKVNLTVIMDCCHSGTITRLLPSEGPRSIERYLADPRDLLAVESGRDLSGSIRSERRDRRLSRTRRSDIVDADIPEMLITGCRDNQTSADAFIDGSFHGALTYHLIKTIRDTQGQLTYRELHSRTTELLKDTFDQVPQLEGRSARVDQPFLAACD